MRGSTKIEIDKFGARVLKLAIINLGATRTIDGKKRVTNQSGNLAKSLDYHVKQKRGKGGMFERGFDLEFTSSKDYASFIEQGVKGSESTKPSASKSPFKYKSKNLPKGVLADWIKNKPIRLRDKDGKFQTKTESRMKSLEFMLGRAIATKGISARHYLKDAVEKAIASDGGNVGVAMALDHIKNDLIPKLKQK
tara:strand:+ start:829 stop:1410 length:582 start_codon:yes stop_codon:yes gene_type:complete